VESTGRFRAYRRRPATKINIAAAGLPESAPDDTTYEIFMLQVLKTNVVPAGVAVFRSRKEPPP